ncbi:MAG: permease-like cell division protein FtsX [Deltaproteobacteria bacterium]|nr:permease-like cell division protein FtsX [Deltaproteobacteria bacterium]
MNIRYGFSRAVRSLLTNWVVSLNNVLILTACLSVLGMVILVYANIIHFSQIWLANTNVSIFLKPQISAEDRTVLLEEVRKHRFVRSAVLITPDKALEELAEKLGAEHSLLSGYKDDVLPYVIDLEVFYEYREKVGELAAAFSARDTVSEVVYAERMLDQVKTFFRIVQGMGWFFIALILVSYYLVISHATRLSLHSRREEIEILNLVGATRGFIRSSFVVEGILVSLSGFLLALGVIWLCNLLLVQGLSQDELTAPVGAGAVFFPLAHLGSALGGALVLGGFSSFLSVNRVLRELEP